MEGNSSLGPLHPSSKNHSSLPNEVIHEMVPGTLLQNFNPKQCDQSPKACTSEGNLADQTPSNPCGPHYFCETCNMSFESVSCLEMLMHNCENQYQQISDEMSDESSKENCTGNEILGIGFQCNVCNKFLSRKHALKIHMRLHAGERPYQCTVCDKAFTSNRNLTVHMLIHSEEKLYHCTVCGKAFNHKKDLTIHMRLHTGERPYHCTECYRTFTSSSHLTKHMQMHIGKKPYQ